MAGVLVNVVPKRVFDFTNVSSGFTESLYVAERIDVSQHADAIVVLRVHSVTATGGTITFDLFGDGFTEEDPGLLFRTGSALFSSTQITSSMGSGPAFAAYGGTARGHYAALRISGSRTASSTLTATVSVDLCLRSPDNT